MGLASASGKSVVIMLNSGTKIYYKISSDAPPRMVIADDGTFALNTKTYTFSNVKGFCISSEDYTGESGTVDGIVNIDDKSVAMKGEPRIYSLDGRLVKKGSDLTGLKPGTYVITNGTTTLKIQKR